MMVTHDALRYDAWSSIIRRLWMYGRPDLYGSTYVAQGLTQHRFKRMSDRVADDLFGPDEIDDEDDAFGFDDDEFAFDDVFGEVSLPSVPGFIHSRLPSWAKGEVMAPGTPPSLPVVPSRELGPATPPAHLAATQVSQAIDRYLERPAQVHGMKLYAQFDGPTWPHALQAAARVAKDNGLVLKIIASDTELPMRGVVGLTLELMPYRR